MKKETFTRFISHQYSKDEYQEMIHLFENEKEFQQLLPFLEEEWDKTKPADLSEERLNILRNRIQQQIQQKKQDQKLRFIGILSKSLQRIAAILVIPLILASLYFYHQWEQVKSESSLTEIICPAGMRTRFILPDGSSGWLNSESSLTYRMPFQKNRDVELKGQAFFDVKKDPAHPFVVNTDLFDIRVLGTRFDVSAYPTDRCVEVTLETGTIEILSNYTPHKKTIIPNQQFVFDKTLRKASLSEVDVAQYTSWKDGRLIFRNTPFSEVINRLGRWYNVEFECQDSSLLDLPYRATFKEESLARVLELLSLTAPITYQINKTQTETKNEYENQKVIIYKK